MPSYEPWMHHPSRWRSGYPHKRRFVLLRFLFIFGGMTIFFSAAMAVVSSLAFGPFQQALPRTAALVLLLCGVPIVFIMLAGIMGGWAFRRFGRPIADVMAAAEAVSNGDLSVRLSEDVPGEIGSLVHSFNHMTVELERAEQQRRSLTADVAHELRTPLHIIQGNLEGILDGVYQPTSEVIETTLEETRLLGRLVSDLQTLSLAEAGQLPLHKQRLPAGDLLQDAATRFSGQAAEAGVDLQVSIKGEAEALEVEVDPDRIGQVLNNLVANALRYTPTGGWIRLSAEPLDGGVRLSVLDNGSGIPEEVLPYVFDRFWKGDPSRTRREGAGSGLGLAIARQLVQAHGGRIMVESKEGHGTNFIIDF